MLDSLPLWLSTSASDGRRFILSDELPLPAPAENFLDSHDFLPDVPPAEEGDGARWGKSKYDCCPLGESSLPGAGELKADEDSIGPSADAGESVGGGWREYSESGFGDELALRLWVCLRLRSCSRRAIPGNGINFASWYFGSAGLTGGRGETAPEWIVTGDDGANGLVWM